MIPFIDLKSQYDILKPQIRERMDRVLEHGHYIMGPEVQELENALAAYTGATHCVTTASGTDALLVSLMTLGIGPGDEVITSPFSFVATVEVIVLLGATPVFVDVEPETGNIDAQRIAAAVTPKTKVIMPVSLYGQPADMDAINVIAARHGLTVIEDGAQSFGAQYRGRKSGNLSTIGCTSFYPSKPLGCYGDGGAIFTSDERLAAIARQIRDHGQERRYLHTRVGVGGRMDTLQCAVVLAKLGRFPLEVEQRIAIGQCYNALFDEAGVRRIQCRPDRTCVFAQYTILVDDRSRLQSALKEFGIPTAVHYPIPLNRQPAYSHLSRPDCCPIAEALGTQVLSLPMSAYLSSADQARIARLIGSH